MPPTRHRSSGSRSPDGRYTRASSKSADRFVACVDVHSRGLHETVEERRPQQRVVAAHRLGDAQRARVGIGRRQAPGVGLGEPGPDQHILDPPAKALLGCQVSRDRTPERQGVRNPVEHGARDLLDEIDLARHVARPPRRHRRLPAVELEPEPGEDRSLLVVGDVEADEVPSALRPQARPVAALAARRGRPRAPRASRRPGRPATCSRGSRPALRRTDRRLSPTCSTPRSGGRGARTSSARRSARSSPPRAAARSSPPPPRSRGHP